MALDLRRKLERLAPPPDHRPPSIADAEKRARIDRVRQLIEQMEARTRIARRTEVRERAPEAALPGETIETSHGPLHRVDRYLPPGHAHGRVPVARALSVRAGVVASLALDPSLAAIDPRRMLLLDTETTGLSGGTGTLPFLIGLAWFEDESLRVEQLFLRRPGEERPLLARLAERIAASSCVVTYNGKAFDWPLLRTRAVMNRVALPAPAAHLDLLHCARRVFARRLGAVRLVEVETAVLGMRRERDVDGAEIPHLYWDFVRGAEASVIAPVIEHNANDVIALAALLAALAERWERVLPAHEPEDRLGIARVALRAGDLARAEAWAVASAESGAARDVAADAWLVAAQAARRASRNEDVARFLRAALASSDRPGIHLALAKHLEHKLRDLEGALAHAELGSEPDGGARRVVRLRARIARAAERAARRGRRRSRSGALQFGGPRSSIVVLGEDPEEMAKPKTSVTAKPAKAAARDAGRTSHPPAVREKLEVETTLPIEPAQLYAAWLDGREHAAFTGGQASCEACVGGRFTAWDGYIEGENLELEPGTRIVQSWRTSDFEDDDPDSRLEIRFVGDGEGTKLVLKHTELPHGGAKKYREGWKQHYFAPMAKYFR